MNIQSVNQAIATLIAGNPWLVLLILWSAVWKLLALWKAARHNQVTWFIVLAVINTLGLLEIGYLIWMYVKEKKEKEA